MRRLTSAATAAVTALVVGVTLAVASGDEAAPTASGSAAGSADDAERAAVEAIAPDLPELLGAFRRAQQAGDRIPGERPSEALRQVGDAQPGEMPTLARRLGSTASDTYAWPMSEGVCYSAGWGGGCGRTSELQRLGLTPGISYSRGEPPRWVISGLARDGVEEVHVQLQDGSASTATVRGNTFRMAVRVEPREISWELSGGARKTISIPAGMYD
jgi:hypothetical protein